MNANVIGILGAVLCCAAAPAIPVVDLSGDKSQDVVIAAGTEEVYQGHPTTVRTADGRLCIVFRDTAQESPTKGSFCGWVGTYDELKSGELGGSYRLKLIHSYGGWDCGYPGIHLLDDGTILATTYIKYWNDARKQSVVSKRFRLPPFPQVIA